MNTKPVKKYPTIGCCGLDCGLCPRYYTVGSSRCPGCCGSDFFNKHPGCSHITCCVKKKNLEVCAECEEFPCSKFAGWDASDSFLTHRKSIYNLNFIKEQGVDEFVKQQKRRIELLEIMLKHFDEGRSKSFYCIATTLLSIKDLETALDKTKQEIKAENIGTDDFKTRSKIFKGFLNNFAISEGFELKLRKRQR